MALSKLSVPRPNTAMWIFDICRSVENSPSSNSSKRARRDAGDLLLPLRSFPQPMAAGDLSTLTKVSMYAAQCTNILVLDSQCGSAPRCIRNLANSICSFDIANCKALA